MGFKFSYGRFCLAVVLIAIGISITTEFGIEDNYEEIYTKADSKFTEVTSLTWLSCLKKCPKTTLKIIGYMYIIGGSLMVHGGFLSFLVVSHATLFQALTLDNPYFYCEKTDECILKSVYMVFHLIILCGACMACCGGCCQRSCIPKRRTRNKKFKHE
jgi:hypothetical protein